MIEQTCKLYPQVRIRPKDHLINDCVQMRDHIDHTEIASPVTNKFYLEQPHGEIYGLDHSRERWVVVITEYSLYNYTCFTCCRFDPLMVAQLRPETDIPGLYLTGQVCI